MIVLMPTERLALMAAGMAAYRAGEPSTACPHKLTGDPWEAARGAAWIRGYVVTRNIDRGYRFPDETME